MTERHGDREAVSGLEEHLPGSEPADDLPGGRPFPEERLDKEGP